MSSVYVGKMAGDLIYALGFEALDPGKSDEVVTKRGFSYKYASQSTDDVYPLVSARREYCVV